MKRTSFFILSLCILLFACSDSNDPIKEIEKPPVENKDPFITLKKTNIDFTNEGGSESILIESNVTWTAKSSAGWCTVTPSSGNKSTASITLSAPANEEYDNRSCTVTIESGAITKTITVNQGENLGLLITQDKYELDNEESTIKVEVKANVEFEVEINDKWISKVDTRGLTTSQIEFKIAENDTYSNRNGSITIKQKDGNISSTIRVYQSQEDAIILSEKDFSLSSKDHSVEVDIKTNVDYEIIIPEDAKDWVTHASTRALRTETVVFDIDQNKDYDERIAKIVVKDKKTDLEETVTINQAANTGIIVSDDKYELSNDGGTLEVEVKANVEFDIEISDNWITRIETRGLTATKLQFQIAKHENYDSRKGTITIKQKGGNLSSTINVYQSQKDAIIISDKTVDVSGDNQAVEVELKTNVEFEVIIPDAAKRWVSYTPTRGLRTEQLTLNISENKDYTNRSTQVYVKNKKTNLQDTLTINQATYLGLIVNNDKYKLSHDGGTIEVEVKANVEFDIEIANNWISRIETRGLTTSNLTFKVAKNESYRNREGTITISQKDGDLSSIITVYQTQENVIILSEKEVEVSNTDQTLEVIIKTNIDIDITIQGEGQNWVSYTPTRGLRTENVILNISANENYYNRTAEVFIKNKELNIQETLIINQRANDKPILKAPANKLTDTNRLPTFRWGEVRNSSGNEFSYIFEYTDNLASWQHSYSLNETVFNLSAYLEANKQYYWRVSAINLNNGFISYSEVNTFTTGQKRSYFDGEYKIAQSNTKGARPSEIIFLGDGYLSEDFEEGGKFDADMDEGIEAFFAVEPYKSYREYFTVYKQAAYSKDRGVMQTDRGIYKNSIFGTNFEGGSRLTTDFNKVFEYAMIIPGVDYQTLNNILISLVVNENRYAGTAWSWSNGKAIAISPVSRSNDWTHFSNIINHEAGGHGFGRLADEYVNYYGVTISESEKTELKFWEDAGFNANVALTGDKTLVKWRHFIDAPGYDRVATFEGAHYYSYGVWRPEISSCMIQNEKYYNAPSREAIVKRIYKTAGLHYTFEAFMEKDIEKTPSQSAVLQTKNFNPLTFIPLAPPVLIKE